MPNNRRVPDEANRYDGAPAPDPTPAPAPSKEEVEAEHRRYLADEGCQHCDEDDVEKLNATHVLGPSCSARQTPRDPTLALCDDCLDARPDSYVEKKLAELREDKDFAVVFDCGIVAGYKGEVPTVDTGDGRQMRHPDAAPTAEVSTRCRCGGHISEMHVLVGGSD